jgi:DNA polymerase-3 subunit gamma/tau
MNASSPNETDSPYQSLYRRYRPQRFSEVRGQEHVALALRNAVRDGRVAHAYLFSGPRGTGKTSTARILAKALDCEAPEDGEPCGICASCVSITNGSSFDVHELDAASNNGVDAMRDLVVRSTLATPGRWKVYIVDEVHMLTTAASNALLKTLEEPPANVVFVLATTDPQKVLPTIRSRTQHFEFHLINEATLDELLANIAKDAGLELPEGALDAAVRRARGSARDALSVLDQVVAAGIFEDSSSVISEIIIAVANNDTAGLVVGINNAMNTGHEPHQLGVDLIERLRAGFLTQFSANSAIPLTEIERDEVLSLNTARIVRTMELIGAALVAMRDAPEPRITLEVALIRCTHPDAETSVEALVERIERLERAQASGQTKQEPTPPPSSPPGPPTAPSRPSTRPATREHTPTSEITPTAAPESQEPEVNKLEAGLSGTPKTSRPSLGSFRKTERPTENTSSAQSTTDPAPTKTRVAPPAPKTTTTANNEMPSLELLISTWESQVLPNLRPKARAIYQATRFIGIEENVVLAGLPNEAHIDHAEPLRADIEAALRTHFGTSLNIRLVVVPAGPPPASATNAISIPTSVRTARDRATKEPHHEQISEDVEEDLSDLGEPLSESASEALKSTNVAWAEDQLKAAFPGAEEIS